jgi:hypothetical protein
LNYQETARARNSSDASLAARLEQIEVLFDLHSAPMNPQAAQLLLERIRRVRKSLEARATRADSARRQMALIRRDPARYPGR